MTDRDRPSFALALHALAETFNEPVSELRAEAYFDALADLPLEAVQTAVRTAIRSQMFFPKPAEIRALVEGTADEQADLAWLRLLREVRRLGSWHVPDLSDDPALERAMRGLFGSWKALCEQLPASGPELLGYAKQFKGTYAVYWRRAQGDRLLPGVADLKRLLP